MMLTRTTTTQARTTSAYNVTVPALTHYFQTNSKFLKDRNINSSSSQKTHVLENVHQVGSVNTKIIFFDTTWKLYLNQLRRFAYRQPMTVFWSRAQHQHHVTTSLMKLAVGEQNVATNLGTISGCVEEYYFSRKHTCKIVFLVITRQHVSNVLSSLVQCFMLL